MAYDIDKYPAESGRVIGEDGETHNLVDLMQGGTAVNEQTYDVNSFPAKSGRVIGEDGKLYNLVDLLKAIVSGEGSIADGSVTIEKLAQDALDSINDKVKKAGDTMTGPIAFADPNNRSKLILAKYLGGTGHNNAPTTLDLNSVYLHLGGAEYNTNSYRLIGFGYRRHEDSSHAAVVAGYQEINAAADDMGDFIVGTRNSTSDVAPVIVFRVTHDGQIVAEQADYVPTSDKALTNKKYVDDFVASKLASLEPIADPSTATIEDVANAYNALYRSSLFYFAVLSPTLLLLTTILRIHAFS